jgi:hypothetical protein
LDLDIDKIITGMDAISSNQNIKDDLEAITGDF